MLCGKLLRPRKEFIIKLISMRLINLLLGLVKKVYIPSLILTKMQLLEWFVEKAFQTFMPIRLWMLEHIVLENTLILLWVQFWDYLELVNQSQIIIMILIAMVTLWLRSVNKFHFLCIIWHLRDGQFSEHYISIILAFKINMLHFGKNLSIL